MITRFWGYELSTLAGWRAPLWVREGSVKKLVVDLRVMTVNDAREIAATIARLLKHPEPPREDVPYHDLYWPEERLMRWPD